MVKTLKSFGVDVKSYSSISKLSSNSSSSPSYFRAFKSAISFVFVIEVICSDVLFSRYKVKLVCQCEFEKFLRNREAQYYAQRQGFLICWYLKNVSPSLLLNKVTDPS